MGMLTVMRGGEKLGERTLDKPIMVVGRDAGCEIQIDDAGTSRRHSELVLHDGAYLVKDLGSANGTFVNGQKVQESPLNDGDEILVGKYTLIYSAAGVASGEAPGKFGGDGTAGRVVNTLRVDSAQIRGKVAALGSRQPGADPLTRPQSRTGSAVPLVIGIVLLLAAGVALAVYLMG